MTDKQLVLVTGAGRSGTSTMAGALHMLGFHLPRPVLQANASNPKGFFESRWPVRFHRRLLERAVVEQTDGRPVAESLVAGQVDEAVRAELKGWLAKQFDQSSQVMVKDPRAAWVPGLWAEVAASLDAQTAYVTMLRHPAEVVRSRESHYHQNRPYMDDVGFAVMSLAGWVNANLTLERLTRGQPRAFVRYDDLRADWRSALHPLRDDLGLRLGHSLDASPHPEVDAFIEPGLNRHQGSFADLGLPAPLVEIADELWALLDAGGPAEELDEVAERYAALYRQSQAIAVDAATAHARVERRRGYDEGVLEGRAEARPTSLRARARRTVRNIRES